MRLYSLLSVLVTGCAAAGAGPSRPAVRTKLQPAANGLASDVTPVLSVGTFGERVSRPLPPRPSVARTRPSQKSAKSGNWASPATGPRLAAGGHSLGPRLRRLPVGPGTTVGRGPP